MIVCRDVVKGYNGRVVLDHLSLAVPAGLCALLGPNGAGKSTLLKLLAGLETPERGEVEVLGFRPQELTRRFRQTIGVLPEREGLFDALTVEEHFALSGSAYGLSSADVRHRTESLIASLQLSASRHTLAGECSHGTRKKVALALALLHNPHALLLDEPFEGIDPGAARAVEQILRLAKARGIVIVLTSHTLASMDRIADQVIFLREGRTEKKPALDDGGDVDDRYFRAFPESTCGELDWLGL